MNSGNKRQPPKVSWEWQEWLDSRAARRAVAQKVGKPISRRTSSSSDKKLRSLFRGERGPDFAWPLDGK